MDNKLYKQSINRLDISDNTITILEKSEIKTLEQLCDKSKTDLKDMGIQQNDIKKAEVQLQLLGLNLKNSL